MANKEKPIRETSVYEIYNAVIKYQELMSQIRVGEVFQAPDFLDSLQFVRYTILLPMGRILTAEELFELFRINANHVMYIENQDCDD